MAFDTDDIRNAAKRATDAVQADSEVGSAGGAEALSEAAEEKR